MSRGHLCTLRRGTRRETTYYPGDVGSILVDVLNGLHAAHEHVDENGRPLDIVHRDVTPQNILVGNDGVCRITDFGVARAASRLVTTQTGQIKGKIPYMAPEQLRLAPLIAAPTSMEWGHLWEALTGKRLCSGQPRSIRTAASNVPRPSEVRLNVPPAIEKVACGRLAERLTSALPTPRRRMRSCRPPRVTA